jgi:ubiquinone/menaquinone biosynthesis C-methylase UbiE
MGDNTEKRKLSFWMKIVSIIYGIKHYENILKETAATKHDGPVGEGLMNINCILVEDRAYGKHQRYDMFKSQGQSFVIRIKDNVKLRQARNIKSLKPQDSNVIKDVTCYLGEDSSKTENRFRVVEFTDFYGKSIRVCTDLMEVTPEKIAAVYKERWKIEDIPLDNETIDVITSNCVINFCESKEDALKEAFRALKNGGRLTIADIVILKDIPANMKQSVELWAGCVAGALSIKEYEEILKKVGFSKIEITSVNIYTKEIVESIVKDKNLDDILAR